MRNYCCTAAWTWPMVTSVLHRTAVHSLLLYCNITYCDHSLLDYGSLQSGQVSVFQTDLMPPASGSLSLHWTEDADSTTYQNSNTYLPNYSTTAWTLYEHSAMKTSNPSLLKAHNYCSHNPHMQWDLSILCYDFPNNSETNVTSSFNSMYNKPTWHGKCNLCQCIYFSWTNYLKHWESSAKVTIYPIHIAFSINTKTTIANKSTEMKKGISWYNILLWLQASKGLAC